MSFEMSDSLPDLILDGTFFYDSPLVNAPALPFAGTDAVDIQGSLDSSKLSARPQRSYSLLLAW